MMELRKTIFNKRMLISLFIIIMMTCFVFAIQSRSSYSKKSIETFNKNEIAYQKEYKNYIQKIMDVNKSYSGISIFEKNTFAKKRGDITSKRYNRITKIKLKQSNGAGLLAVLQFTPVHFLLFIALILIVFSYMDYEHLSLRLIISSSLKGRTHLMMKRICILMITSLILHMMIYSILIIESSLLFKIIPSFHVSVQSLSYFKDFNLPLTLGSTVLIYIVLSSFLLSILSMVLWLILTLFTHRSIGTVLFTILFSIEYLVYSLLSSSHPLALFKYNNLYLLFNPMELLRGYKTYSFMSQVVEAFRLFLLVSFIFFIFLVLSLLICGHSKRVFHHSLFSLMEKKISRIHVIKRMIERFSFLFQEFYKIIIAQRGWLLIIGLIVIFIGMQDTSPYMMQGSTEQRKAIYEKYGGPYNKGILEEYIEPCKEKYFKESQSYEKTVELYEQKKVSQEDLFYAQMRMDNVEQEYNLVKEIEQHVNQVKKNKSWLIDQTGWKMMLGKDGHYIGEGYLTIEKEVMLITAFICFFFCNMWDYDQRSDMNLILRVTLKGREFLYNKRILMYFIVSLLSILFLEIIEFYVSFKVYPLTYFNAPLNSLLFFKDVPISFSIGFFLILLTIYRVLSLFALSLIINLILMKIRGFKGGMLCLILFVLPQLLSMLHINIFKYISLIQPVMIIPLIDDLGFSKTSGILLIFYIMGYIAYKLGKREWSSDITWKSR